MKLIEFNLEKALANPERVVCRDGVKLVQLTHFTKVNKFAFIRPDASSVYIVGPNGRFYNEPNNSRLDLFLLPETKLVPFTRETFIPHRDRWINFDGGLCRVIQFDDNGVILVDARGKSWAEDWSEFYERTFEDGSECGLEVEE